MSRTLRVVRNVPRMAVRANTASLGRVRHFSQSGKSGERSYRSSKWVGAGLALGVTGLTLTAAVAEGKMDDKGSKPAGPSTPGDYAAVRKSIADVLEQEGYDDGSYGPVLIRLAWHASGTYDKNAKNGGSNGATMRFEPECKHGANAGLQVARDRLEPVKKAHPWISYADLWTLAGVVAVEEMGGPQIAWRPGRSDAPDGKCCPPDGRLPDAAQGEKHVRDIFYRMGFDDREIVALLGAHSMGRCHKNRSGYDGPWTRAPTTVSNEFYRVLLEEKWTERKWDGPRQFENAGKDLMMLPGDMSVIKDPEFKKIVELYAKDEEAWRKDFAKAFSKLLELGVPFKDGKAAKPAEDKKSGGWFFGLFGGGKDKK